MRKPQIYLNFLFISCSLLLFFACRNFFEPSRQIEEGKGYFSLTINGEGAEWTILPITIQDNFSAYELVFISGKETPEPDIVNRTNANLSAPVLLNAGTWNLYVTAFMDEDKAYPVAHGELLNIVIGSGKTVAGSIILAPIIGEGVGTFNWNIDFDNPDNIASASMTITGLGVDVEPYKIKIINMNGSLLLGAGYYSVVFYLVNIHGQTTMRMEILHIYQNMISAFAYTFTDSHFPVAKSGGVVFTFDDKFVDAWYDLHNLLDNTNWKATFFVMQYNTLNRDQIDKLKKLQEYGHEIGSHSYNHTSARDYARDYGIDAYLENEIYPLNELMAEDGFTLTSFAYPFGHRNVQTDAALLNEFKIIRGITGASNDNSTEPSLLNCYYNNNKLIFGLGIDSSYGRSNEYLFSILDYAKKENKIVIFYAHNPRRIISGNYQVEYLRMVELCKYINDNNMKFYTVSDLIPYLHE